MKARWSWGLALLGAGVAACGSDEMAPVPASQDPSTTSRADVLAACSAFALRLCESAQSCCESTTGAFVADDCVSGFVSQVCEPSASLVQEGLADYDPSAEEACLAARQRAHEACVPDWEEVVAIRREVWAACKVVRGKIAPGHSCSTDAMCAQPDGAATSACVSGVCRQTEILGEGAECPYPNGDVSVCDLGLYCTATERDVFGTCAPATPLGEACEPVALNPECGLGNYCDLVDGTCKKAVNFGGPSCEQDLECVSFLCDKVSDSTPGRCNDAPSTVMSLCGGSAP